MTKGTLIKTGQVLIAEPFMLDPYFRRSVVLLCAHDEEDGSIGFILNKGIAMTINDLVADFPTFEGEVFYGGPVQTDTLHYIHSAGELLDDSVPLCPGVWWGGDFEQLKFLISSGLLEPNHIRFFVGYSGWSSGQLDEEMSTGSWVTGEMHPNYAFKTSPRRLWSQAMHNKGDLFEVIADMPEQMFWN